MTRARIRSPKGYPFLRLAAGFLLAAGLATVGLMRPSWQPPEATQDPAHAVTSFQPERAASILQSRHDAASVRALSFIARRGADGAVVELNAGQAGGWASDPVAGDTVFEAASLSKPVTAWAVLQLARDGLVELDAPVIDGEHTFTLRDVLHHAAGFDNALSRDPHPVGPAGRFAYAGEGYNYLAGVIEAVTETDFATHMNTVVLPGIGMTDSAFGASPDAALAMPAIDAGMVVAFAILGAALVFLVPGLVLGGLSAGLHLRRGPVMTGLLALTVSLSVVGGLVAALLLPGFSNLATVGPVAASTLALLLLASALLASPGRWVKRSAALPLALLLMVGVTRPAVMLEERTATYLAPAGLRTTAGDYLTFLDTVIQAEDPTLRRMLSDVVPVQAETGWGLGIAVEAGDAPAIWHWGINYPGYQAFAIAWPETGDAAVILMAGGEMSFSPDGMRYSGLELALTALSEAGAPLDGTYWHGIQ